MTKRISNFDFLEEEINWENLFERSKNSERFAIPDDRVSFIYSRMALELIIELIYEYEGLNSRNKDLFKKIDNQEFNSIISFHLKDKIDSIRMCGNKAVHNKNIANENARTIVKNLFDFTKWFYENYGEINDELLLEFNSNLLPKENSDKTLNDEDLKALEGKLKQENMEIIEKYSLIISKLETKIQGYEKIISEMEKDYILLQEKLSTRRKIENYDICEIGLTEQIGSIWGRVFINLKINNTDYFAVKYFSPNQLGKATERFVISEGTYQKSNLFQLFSKRLINLLKRDVLDEKYDYLDLVLKYDKPRFGTPSILLKKLITDLNDKLKTTDLSPEFNDIGQYEIADILGDSCNRLYVLESPHSTEIKSKIPASGQTGIVMSQVLFNTSTPMGLAIRNGEIDGVGILNACQFPLDGRVYKAIPNALLEYMNIKKLTYSGISFNNDIKEKLNEIDKLNTVANFRKRLESVVKEKESKEIIVCGFISQAYIELAYPELINVRFKTWTELNINGGNVNIRYTHHPSPKRGGNSWAI
jgi:hypothetical protein